MQLFVGGLYHLLTRQQPQIRACSDQVIKLFVGQIREKRNHAQLIASNHRSLFRGRPRDFQALPIKSRQTNAMAGLRLPEEVKR